MKATRLGLTRLSKDVDSLDPLVDRIVSYFFFLEFINARMVSKELMFCSHS